LRVQQPPLKNRSAEGEAARRFGSPGRIRRKLEPTHSHGEATTPADHHSEYLARTVAALTPEGRARVDELLDQLAAAAGGRERLVRFAAVRRAEADTAELESAPDELTRQELDALTAGFMAIRDGEQLDDVADWANAVLALLQDEPRAG